MPCLWTATSPHAQIGNHLRVNTHPLLGLPVAPFVVHRADIRVGSANKRTTASFFDDEGNSLSLPIDVTPDRPVNARMVRGVDDVCIWAQIIAEPDRGRPGIRATDSSGTSGICSGEAGRLASARSDRAPGRRSRYRRSDRADH